MADLRRDAFDTSALVHMRELLRVAVRLCGARAPAEDLVQETFLQAWKSFGRFEPGTNCRAWLYKIMLFVHAQSRRKLARGPALVDLDRQIETALMFDPPTPDNLTADALKAAFDKLPEAYRHVILFVDVEDLSYRETAEALGVPIGTVMSRVSRARRLLRHELARQAADYFGKAAAGKGASRDA